MSSAVLLIREQMDRFGIILSGLCAAHCIASIAIISVLGVGGGTLLDPIFHEVGLALAVLVAAVAIGWGAIRHRKVFPFTLAIIGLAFMAAALVVPHGIGEATLTIIGVALVSTGHLLNLRSSPLHTR